MHFLNLSLSFFLYLLIGADLVVAKLPVPGTFTGINSQTGERPRRREIRVFQRDTPAFSLYIRALQAMQDTPEADQLSWFQIAGIHGRPYYAWDGNANKPGAPGIGYCTHGDILFMSWHRPYLALYEQILAKHVTRIAKKYNSATYTNAAKYFRIPYWDWASAPYAMPDFLSSQNVRIQDPSGFVDTWNPLSSYKFRNQPYRTTTFPRDSLSTSERTRRRPNCGGCASQPGNVNNLLNAQGAGIAQQLYTIFSRATSYNVMATQSSNGPSFEGPHGWLHVTVGGQGHMTDVGYSAFDPIFWLHHTNVDRLLAMWQAIYPNSFMTPGTEQGGNWFLQAGQSINKDTWLVPFFGADGKTAWTTERARHTKTFGYSYPDVLDWQFTGNNAAGRLSAAVTQRVNNLYNINGRSGKLAMRGLNRRDTPHEWTADVSAPNAALSGASFTVSLFMGERPADPNQWPFKSIGALYVLAQPSTPVAGPMFAHTEIILTQFMEDAGIDSSNITAGKEFLDKSLTWGVQKFDGTVIPNEEFEGLNIVIEDDVVKLPTSDTQLPKYSDKTIHEDISPAITAKK